MRQLYCGKSGRCGGRGAAAALVAAASLALGAGLAGAAEMQLLDSGWTASWADVPDTTFKLALQDVGVGTEQVMFTKVATLGAGQVDAASGSIRPLAINFRQTDPAAKSLVVVSSEVVTNYTGIDWTGFRFQLLDNRPDAANQAHFDVQATGTFNAAYGFHISPFTTGTYSALSSANQDLLLSGGKVANGSVWHPGGGGTLGQLVIHAVPAQTGDLASFSFTEQPMAAPGPLPEPASIVVMGLAGLMFLGRRVRR